MRTQRDGSLILEQRGMQPLVNGVVSLTLVGGYR